MGLMRNILFFLAVAFLVGLGLNEMYGKSVLSSLLPIKADYVTLHTNQGDIQIQLYHAQTPKTAENFWLLARGGKYDETLFHRVIDGFMIQGGDYENFDGTGGKSAWGDEFEDEIDKTLSHVRGAVSMANRGPGTNGSQFFIVQAPDTKYLDGRHTIFGHVTKGMDIVDKIAKLPTDSLDKPFEDVVIEDISLQLK